ncbi:MAG: PepSY domain-containing protein [Chthoniobacter sp.]|uniref:PepSY domain-containing protein n=1 Tax=Chthoniobacter sp. TaxID=2510640 RepID=UPI0032A4CDB2
MKSSLTPSILSLSVVLGLGLSAASAADETQAELKAQTKITQAEASKTALAKVPNGKIKSEELEKENGKLIYSFDITMPSSKSITEVQVDAKTGKIVSTQVETPKDQAKEVAADKLEKKKK